MSVGKFRDCRFCAGRGCLACPGEADKAYKSAFPGGAKPIATFKRDSAEDMATLVEVLHIDRLAEAQREARREYEALGDDPFARQGRALALAIEGKPVRSMMDRVVDRIREIRPQCLGEGTEGKGR